MTATTSTQSERPADLAGLTPLIETTTSSDPARVYERLQARWGNVAPVLLAPGVRAWLVLGHRELATVLRSERLYSRDSRNWGLVADGTVDPSSGVGAILAPRDSVYYVDGERHRHLRRLVDDAFDGFDEHRLAVNVRLLVLGSEFEVAWITQALRMRLTDPRFDGRSGGRLSASDALEAVLGSIPPASNTAPRYALADTVLGRRKIWAGDAVVPGILGTSAESRAVGDDIWLEPGNLSYLTWGAGPHACPVRRPATVIAKVAVEAALRRLGGVTLTVPPESLHATGTLWSSMPWQLPVRFEAR